MTHRFLTPEGAKFIAEGWAGSPFVYVSKKLEEVVPVSGAPTETNPKQCTVWTALRDVKHINYETMCTITPHCMHAVTASDYEIMQNIVTNHSCVENLWYEIENSREVKRQRK